MRSGAVAGPQQPAGTSAMAAPSHDLARASNSFRQQFGLGSQSATGVAFDSGTQLVACQMVRFKQWRTFTYA